MSKELEALNILRDNHIEYTKEKYRNLTSISVIQNIINLKLAQWDILEQALKRNEPMKLKTKRVKVSIDDYRIDDYCPTCGEELYATSNYCPMCGQRLDWSDDK